MKKTYLAALVPFMLFSLVGCGGGGGATDDRRTLKIEFVDAGFGNKPYEKLAEAFMAEHADVKVKLVANRQMADTTATRIENGTASDVMIYNRTVNNIRLWSKRNLVLDLTDLFKEEVENGQTLEDKLDDNGKKISYYDGKYLTVPEFYNINGFVYNATLFDKYGWETPKTTKQFEDLCNTINSTTLPGNYKIKPLVYCQSADGYLYYADEGWATAYEGVSNLDEFYKFESAEVYAPERNVGKLKGLQLLKKYFFDSSYEVEGSSTLDATQAQNKLLTYDAAMMLNGSWFENEMSSYMTSSSPTFKMFKIPEISDASGDVLHSETYTKEEGKESVLNCEVNTNMFIPTKAKNIDDAKEFLKFVAKSSSCEIWTQYSNAVRPMNYNYSPSNPAYKDMSAFGKSVLEIATNNCLYVPNSTADISVIGKAGFRPMGGYWFWKFKENTPEQCVQKDYNHAKEYWDLWVREAQETFGN